ncbi:hypothetical protein KLP40_10560 [Hymenobacter sp. NST-14]|uniref:hypothetical protein n=1 Tax=Hymenobacter piscis TaxID=2839984 RepID=UPI001C02B26F|nr:hypothetical protein [Hymenobacter piscis]MBT9393603.1 hypothetical protein [Hymenobacter piscis]
MALPSLSATSFQSSPVTYLKLTYEKRPLIVRALAVVALYGLYFLLGGGLTGQRMPYDAGEYWELATSFRGPDRQFSLLTYHYAMRGYCAALVQFPALVVRLLTNSSMPVAAKTAGIGWAVLLMAWLLPALWQSIKPGRLDGRRWLVFLLLSFAFWRDHFSFSLTDVPALTLLLLALWSLSRSAVVWWLVAGLSLAAAFNSRPVYLASVVPALGLAVWWSSQHPSRQRVGRWVALLLGLALVMSPQLRINQLHFQRNTPFVLARIDPKVDAYLYLQQLTWGTRILRYDTSLEHRLFYADPAGVALLRAKGIGQYASYAEYLGVVARHPLNFAFRYLRHLFNGLDVQQPAPYLLRSYGWETPWVQLLNYSALGIALGLILLTPPRRWLTLPRALLLLAILIPCLASVPTAIEVRFLLPLHLLLLWLTAFCFSPSRCRLALAASPRQALVMLLAAVVWLGGCFWLSAATFRNLAPDTGELLALYAPPYLPAVCSTPPRSGAGNAACCRSEAIRTGWIRAPQSQGLIGVEGPAATTSGCSGQNFSPGTPA